MLTVPYTSVGTRKVLIDRDLFDELIRKLGSVESITTQEIEDDIPVEGIMRLVESDKAFEFLNDPREDIYTIEDLKERF